MSAGSVLLVGWSAEAVEAATRLGYEVVLVEAPEAGRRRRRGIAERVLVPLDAPAAALLDALRRNASRRDHAAVLGATEASVEAAARLRHGLGLPGVAPDAARAAHDKLAMKRRVRRAGLLCAETLRVRPDHRPEELAARLGLPIVVKRRAASGGRGTVIARDLPTLAAALRPGRLAEAFVAGLECSHESYRAGGRAIFQNLTRYLVPGVANVVPGTVGREERRVLDDFADRAARALGIERGIVHLELFRTSSGPVFGELAARPPGGRIMRLMERAYGFDAWEALWRVELGEAPELPRHAHSAAGAWYLHPGAGRVRAIRGLDEARRVEGVVGLELRVEPGDLVAPRLGTGQSVGCIEAVGCDDEEVAARLHRAASLLTIEMDA